jgi:IS30 family transposase
MGFHYCHLTGSDRIRIEVFLRLGVTQSGVAQALGRPRSTISREVGRAKSHPTCLAPLGSTCAAAWPRGCRHRRSPVDFVVPA